MMNMISECYRCRGVDLKLARPTSNQHLTFNPVNFVHPAKDSRLVRRGGLSVKIRVNPWLNSRTSQREIYEPIP